MPKYRKNPIVIEATQFTEADSKRSIFEFTADGNVYHFPVHCYDGVLPSKKTLQINTAEGVMTASVGDWIIVGVNGEIYPCKPDIFEKTYEPV